MMNRKEFEQYLQDNVKDYLPESFADAKIVFNEVVKNNDQHMTGMSIIRDNEAVVPNIYIDSFYQQYQEGRDNLLTTADRGNGDGMFCLTNGEKMNGASLVLQDDLMQQIGDIVGGNFYVLPSSVHEVLIVPDNGTMELRDLSAMVYEVNRTEVAPQDRLSDNVQYYDTETRTLENAQDREARKELEKPEKMTAKESKKGIHERLGEKKAQAKAAPKADKAMEKAAKKNKDISI